MRLTEVLELRISTELKQAIEEQAKRLRVRPIDVIRMAIAEAVSHQNSEDDNENNQESGN